MKDSLNICLACGLCCDGTLIGYVHLDKEEMPTLKKIMDIEDEAGEGFFLQPCDKYCDGCTIYPQRPKQCNKFICKLLKSVEQKKLEFDLAVGSVHLVKQKKIEIEKNIVFTHIKLQSSSFYFRMVELKKILQKNKLQNSSSQKQLELMNQLNELDSLLLEKFNITMD